MKTTPLLSVLLAEDYVLLRREIKKIIEEIPDVKIVGEAGDGPELFELLKNSSPDLVFLDISLPRLKALEATRIIKQDYPRVKVLIMIMEDEKEYWTRAIAAGANGVLLKQDAATEVARAIMQLRRGKNYLPPQLAGERSANRTFPASQPYF